MELPPYLRSGYAFRFEGKGCWKKAKDDDWEIVMIDAIRGKYLGWRRIDGARCAVYETKRGLYAQVVFGPNA